MGLAQPSHLCFVLQELQTHLEMHKRPPETTWYTVARVELTKLWQSVAGSRGKIPSLSSFPTNLVHQAFDSLCSARIQVALRTRPDVLCLPWASWTLNSSVVAQLKPGTTEMQQEQSKETLPALPKPNQHMDESTRFFPNFPLLWFVLSLPKFLQDVVKKQQCSLKGITSGICVPDTCKGSHRNYQV